MRVMAIRISEGRGCQSDARAATSTYVRAAEAGDATAEFNLGVRYASGNGILPTPAASNKAFYLGGGHVQDPQTQNDVQHEDVFGDDFSQFAEQDFSQTRIALEWYKRAAAKGHCKALYNLANMMAKGETVPLTEDGAAGLLLQAARKGYARAQYALALHLAQQAEGLRRSCVTRSKSRQGRGRVAGRSAASPERGPAAPPAPKSQSPARAVGEDVRNAVSLPAETIATSLQNVSGLVEKGGGAEVVVDEGSSPTHALPSQKTVQDAKAMDEESLRWLVAAADRRYAKALYALGLKFADGRGSVERNLTTAMGYFLRSVSCCFCPVALSRRRHHGACVQGLFPCSSIGFLSAAPLMLVFPPYSRSLVHTLANALDLCFTRAHQAQHERAWERFLECNESLVSPPSSPSGG